GSSDVCSSDLRRGLRRSMTNNELAGGQHGVNVVLGRSALARDEAALGEAQPALGELAGQIGRHSTRDTVGGLPEGEHRLPDLNSPRTIRVLDSAANRRVSALDDSELRLILGLKLLTFAVLLRELLRLILLPLRVPFLLAGVVAGLAGLGGCLLLIGERLTHCGRLLLGDIVVLNVGVHPLTLALEALTLGLIPLPLLLLVRLVLLPLKALVFALSSAIQLTLELLQLLTVLLGLLSASLVVPRSGLHERDVERVNPKDAANVGHMPITERLGGLVDNLVTDLTPIDCGDALLNHLGGDDEVVRDAVPIPAAGLPLNGPGQCLPLGDGEDRLVLHLVAVLIAARWACLPASGAGQVVHLNHDLRPTDEPHPLGAHNRFAAGEHVRRDAVNVPTRRVARQDAPLSVPPVCLPEAASVTRIAVAVLNVPRT